MPVRVATHDKRGSCTSCERAIDGHGTAPSFEPQIQRYRDYARQRQMTLGDLLLENRIVFLGSSPETGGNPAITDYLANITIQKLLYLQYENQNQEIHFYINCPGGSVTATLAIYDTMQFLECPIATYCMGLAASGAAIMLGGRHQGQALRPAPLQDHDPPAVGPGRRPGVRHRDPGQRDPEGPHAPQRDPGQAHRPADRERSSSETDRDRYFTPQEAKEFGLVDEVLHEAAPRSEEVRPDRSAVPDTVTLRLR